MLYLILLLGIIIGLSIGLLFHLDKDLVTVYDHKVKWRGKLYRLEEIHRS